MSDQPQVDDSYLDGIYYSLGTSECYQIDRDETTGEAILIDMDGDEADRLDPEEWITNQDDFYPVPEDAIRNPVRYYQHRIDHALQSEQEFDVGFVYAREMTEVVEND